MRPCPVWGQTTQPFDHPLPCPFHTHCSRALLSASHSGAGPWGRTVKACPGRCTSCPLNVSRMFPTPDLNHASTSLLALRILLSFHARPPPHTPLPGSTSLKPPDYMDYPMLGVAGVPLTPVASCIGGSCSRSPWEPKWVSGCLVGVLVSKCGG